MFDLPLLVHVTARAFSRKAGSLRYPTPKRLCSVFITLPLFLVLTVVNRLFMALDHLLFPAFAKQRLTKCTFITGVPRSATTYTYSLLAKDSRNFTCFRMWELLFAPSVTQRYLLAPIRRLDGIIGRPLYRLSLQCDRIFLGRITRLHETGLSKPEEDETLLLYAFASVYLIFFFPGVPALDNLLYFDEEVAPAKRRQIMQFYRRCIQRHVYFHDRHEEKYFLSKNPTFVSKTISLAETFERARLIYMLRSPENTIPSTINLNRNIFSMISGDPDDDLFATKTKESVIRWYQMADRSIAHHWRDACITVPFKAITLAPDETLAKVYVFLGIKREVKIRSNQDVVPMTTKNGQTTYASLGESVHLIPELNFIFQGPFRELL